jgi:hypothetical protein
VHNLLLSYLVEFGSIAKLKKLLDNEYKIEKIQPAIFASDAEVNIVTVVLVCPDGKKETIRAYREESQAFREYIRNMDQKL